MIRSTVLAIPFLLASAAPLAAAPADTAEKVQAYLDRHFDAGAPGVAAIIVDDGEVVYLGAAGAADVESSDALAADSVFRLGSITKQFAAATVMKLVEQGKISLDDPLSEFLPDYPNGDAITVHMLLNHTSGITSYTGIPGWMIESNTARQWTTEEMIAQFADRDPDFEPGEAWRYNNSGYVLVGAVIEKVTGQKWYDAVNDLLLEPAGIDTIDYMGAEGDTPKFVNGYTSFAGTVVAANKIDGSAPHAAGALIGDVEGLAKWYDALFDGEVVSEASLELMTTPTTFGDDGVQQYGYGLSLGETLGAKRIGHGGGIFGFNTASEYFPEEDLFVAVFANSDSPALRPGLVLGRLAGTAMGNAYRDFDEVEWDPASAADWVGVYEVEGEEALLWVEDGTLKTRAGAGQGDRNFLAAGEGIFFRDPSESLTWFKLARADDGTPQIELHNNGNDEAVIVKRAGDLPEGPRYIDLTADQQAALLGDYRFPFGVLTIAVNDAGKLTGQLEGQPALPIDALTPTEFELTRVGAAFTFVMEDGRASQLTLKQGGGEFTADRVTE